jgi:preprotein translocase subunit YajC
MTQFPAEVHLLAAAAKTSSSSPIFLIGLFAIAILGYFFFLKPQQRKAAAARANVGSGYEVGDEVQTIGGIIGTILEIHGDRYTLLTGSTEADGNLDGPQPTRIVFVRQAIARKVDRIVDVDDVDEVDDVDVDEDEDVDVDEVEDHDEHEVDAEGDDHDHEHEHKHEGHDHNEEA